MKSGPIALMIYGEPGSARNALTEEKYKKLAAHFKEKKFDIDSVIYHDSIAGKLGKELNEEQGKEAARQCGLAILASIKDALGSIDKVKRVIKILGMVNAVPEFDKHPIVINGCSELFAQLWGEDGIGVRSAVGMGSLPNNVAVEIEALFEI